MFSIFFVSRHLVEHSFDSAAAWRCFSRCSRTRGSHQRVPHLVGEPAASAPRSPASRTGTSLLGAAQALLRLEDPLDHPVEGGGELPHLVSLDDFHAQRVIPRRDLLRGGGKLADGGDHGPVEKDPPEEDEDGDVDHGQQQRDVHQGPHLGGDPWRMETDPDAAGDGKRGGCDGRGERTERKDHIHGRIHREERKHLLPHGDNRWPAFGRRFRQQATSLM